MASSETAALVSQRGMIHVLEYSPVEGEHDVPITVRIHFAHDANDTVFLRLVIGPRAVATDVAQLEDYPSGAYELTAAAPQLDLDMLGSPKVLVTVQALDKDNAILDSLTFGEFTYWTTKRSPSTPPNLIKKEQVLTPTSLNQEERPRRHSVAHVPSSAMPTKPELLPYSQRRLRANSLMRTKYPAPRDNATKDDLLPQTPILVIATSLMTIIENWSPAEIKAGRRLVRFHKVQDGRKIILSCETISREEYSESDSVISCIYRADTHNFYFTSVDIIYLLERLTNDYFPVEEKNRIRRNLEGLRPTTVSKSKPEFEKFFIQIMDFLDPKPRNIEKDLKVFEWHLLGAALNKILSKYSIYTSSPTDSTVSLPLEPGSPLLQASQLCYPQNPNENNTNGEQQPPAKVEPSSEPLLYLSPQLDCCSDDGGVTFQSAYERPASVILPEPNEIVKTALKHEDGGRISLYSAEDAAISFDGYLSSQAIMTDRFPSP